MNKGTIIVFEGLDCSFKETNSKALVEFIKANGNEKVKLFHIPNYGSPSCYFVTSYLRGMYGDNPMDINPQVAGLFYSLDRFDTYQKEIKPLYEDGWIIVLDRFTMSNVYQMAKIEKGPLRDKYYEDLKTLEYDHMRMPKPDITLFMNTPCGIANKLMKEKNDEYDIHEKAAEYQEKVYNVALRLAYTEDGIEVVDNVYAGELKSKEEIFKSVIKTLGENGFIETLGLTYKQMEEFNICNK